jgi:hypothetical protein
MLQKDPARRPSASQCLADPFFTQKVNEKKLFFATLKDQAKLCQTADFEGAVANDVVTKINNPD